MNVHASMLARVRSGIGWLWGGLDLGTDPMLCDCSGYWVCPDCLLYADDSMSLEQRVTIR